MVAESVTFLGCGHFIGEETGLGLLSSKESIKIPGRCAAD